MNDSAEVLRVFRGSALAVVRDAMAWAADGGQALHVWPRAEAYARRAPGVFRRSELWGHLFDQDAARLRATARALGVRVIAVGREGELGQHIDLCGRPLERAMARAARRSGG